MGLKRGGFILMISHYGRVAILGCIEIHYYYLLFFFARIHINLANKQTKQREEGGKKERKRNKNRAGENVISKGTEQS